MQLCSCFCVFACFALLQVEAQDPTATGVTNRFGFIDPISGSGFEDSFLFGDVEYLFVNNYLTKSQADKWCLVNYNAKLGYIKTKEEAQYLADALTETNFELEYMWVGGKITVDNETHKETWTTEDNKPFPEELNDFRQPAMPIHGVTLPPRPCVSFGRFFHDQPRFIPLSCSVFRPVICERGFKPDNRTDDNNNHWIVTSLQEYKLFYHRVSFENASINCFRWDQQAELAKVPPADVHILGRYLLIGRPSVENAWIGAKYQQTATGEPELDLAYKWRDGSDLSREVNQSIKYAPWKDEKATKAGCVLLDRHLSETVLFVEAPCYRLRPYICSRPLQGASSNIISASTDFSLELHDYRLYYTAKGWGPAKRRCEKLAEAYGITSVLTEIRDNTTMKEVLFILGENRTAIQHLWIGGLYDSTDPTQSKWVWQSDKSDISSPAFTIIRNISNGLYPDGVFYVGLEGNNRCLNLDRENHVQGLVYGADCSYAQPFTCQLDKGVLNDIPSQIDDNTFPPRLLSNKRKSRVKKTELEEGAVSQLNPTEAAESEAKVEPETTTSAVPTIATQRLEEPIRREISNPQSGEGTSKEDTMKPESKK